MQKKARAGLLPLYIELYDKLVPNLISQIAPFARDVERQLVENELEVVTAPVCRVEADVRKAIHLFAERHVDVIITLHLAYSPSLEAIEALCDAPQPVIMLDTTPDPQFGRDADPERINYNHGIHGVQDLANLLWRRKKPYWVIAGHLSDKRVTARAKEIALFCRAAKKFSRIRVLRIGPTFEGMGDFRVESSMLKERFGIEVQCIQAQALERYVQAVTEKEIADEINCDCTLYAVTASQEALRRSARLGLALRRCLQDGGYDAFSMNFMAFTPGGGLIETIPLFECAKSMARGIGYAGEGDVLTASLVAALMDACPETSFTEMFCADWGGNSIFLSHLGEFNPIMSDGKCDVYEKELGAFGTNNCVTVACAPKPGPATLVNIAPGPEDMFRMIVADVDVMQDGLHSGIQKTLRAWVKPQVPVATFLEKYSGLGGTHHSALMRGQFRDGLGAFAQLLGLDDYCAIP